MVSRLGWMLLLMVGLGPCLAQKNNPSNDDLDSILWVQTSAEWRMNCAQAWSLAETQLTVALADQAWTAAEEQTNDLKGLPPAVIVDVDETVLDNSAFQADLIQRNQTFDSDLGAWDRWLARREAWEIPGALSFAKKAKELGVTIYYVTNRACGAGGSETCPQEADTIANLKALGFPDITHDNVMLNKEKSTWESEKSSRRKEIAQSHRILLLVGDDLGDFLQGSRKQTLEERAKNSADHQSWFGKRWIILPNPVYGSWKHVLKEPLKKHLRGYQP